MPYPFDLCCAEMPLIPARSRFHALEPVGIGTPMVESLTSYVIRLADSHAVRVGDLITRELTPLVGWMTGTTNIRYSLDGVGKTAQRCVEVLGKLTSIKTLQYLTMLPFSLLFPAPRLVRSMRAWCPQCYSDMRERGQTIWDPLLWSLRSVEACTQHNRLLETKCPFCEQPLRPIARSSTPGRCSICHQWLCAPKVIDRDASRPSAYQIWVGLECGILLSYTQHLQASTLARSLPTILSAYVKNFAQGNRLAAAEAGGCRTTTFHRWSVGTRQTARIDVLLKTCYQLSIPFSSLVSGAGVDAYRMDIDIRAARDANVQLPARKRQVRHTSEHIYGALQAALVETPAPSLGEVACRLGYLTATQLRLVDPECCKQISRNYHNSSRSYWWRQPGVKPKYTVSFLKQLLKDNLALDLPKPVHHLAADLGYLTTSPFIERFPALCDAIKVKRKEKLDARIASIRPLLKAALRERPVPSLKEFAIQNEFSPATLRKRAPDLCEKMRMHRAKSQTQELFILEKRLRAALREQPPPTVRDVYDRLGTKRWVVRNHFPELNKALGSRSRQCRYRRHKM